MKISQLQVSQKLARIKVQYHRFPGTNAVVAVAHDDNGFIYGTGVGSCIDPAEFDETIGQQVAHKNAMTQATDKVWEEEGILLREKMRIGKIESEYKNTNVKPTT
jgi:hypothetical protein